jgi:hypothetical protein
MRCTLIWLSFLVAGAAATSVVAFGSQPASGLRLSLTRSDLCLTVYDRAAHARCRLAHGFHDGHPMTGDLIRPGGPLTRMPGALRTH